MWPCFLQRTCHSKGLSPPWLAVAWGLSAHRFALIRALSHEQPGQRTHKDSNHKDSNHKEDSGSGFLAKTPATQQKTSATKSEGFSNYHFVWISRLCPWVVPRGSRQSRFVEVVALLLSLHKNPSATWDKPHIYCLIPQPRVPRFHHKACDNEINNTDVFPFYNCHGNYIVT